MKALSLFSGIGGIDLACEWAGIETVAFCEREKFPQKVLRKHWPNVPIYDDVCTLTKERLDADGIGTIDIIHGGYPCQPFSTAGERKGKDDDRHLWPEVRRLIEAIQPRWFVGENVAGHITLGLDEVLSDLGDLGYTTEAFVIPAAAVNAPHRRDRVFIVANSMRSFHSSEQKSKYQDMGGGQNTLAYGEEQFVAGQTMADTLFKGLQRGEETGDIGCSRTERNKQFAGCSPSGDTWSIEPPVGRVANGVPQRVDRLKALGNAVVPQQIYPILAAIKQIDDMIKEEST